MTWLCTDHNRTIQIWSQLFMSVLVPSVLWHCWLSGRKGIRPVKNKSGGGAGVVVCLERGADLHMVQLMPLPLTVSWFSKIQIGFTFVVPAHLCSPGKRAVKWVCVCLVLIHYCCSYFCLPAVLGKDCIGCAKTGSGKTAAFALPILQKLCEDPYGIFALVLSPTR